MAKKREKRKRVHTTSDRHGFVVVLIPWHNSATRPGILLRDDRARKPLQCVTRKRGTVYTSGYRAGRDGSKFIGENKHFKTSIVIPVGNEDVDTVRVK